MRSYKTDQKAARSNTRIVFYYSFVGMLLAFYSTIVQTVTGFTWSPAFTWSHRHTCEYLGEVATLPMTTRQLQ